MMIQTLGQTTNFIIQYEDTLPNAIKRARALLAVVENEFAVLTSWFNINSGFGPGNRVTVRLNQLTGARSTNSLYKTGGNTWMNLAAQDLILDDSIAAEEVKMIFVNEFVEILMSYNNQHGPQTWNPLDSNGEGLSQLCGIERFSVGHKSFYPTFPFINAWLVTGPRTDWITNPEGTDADFNSIGCALLFLCYLKSQLGFSIPQIIQRGGSTLETTYRNLTGSSGAYMALTALLNQYFPVGRTPQLNTECPFPLLDLSHRQLILNTYVTPNGTPTHIGGGDAVEGFLGCGPRSYHFDINSTPKTLTCVASNIGFGQPIYSWRVNGVAVSTGQIQPMATVFVDDPNSAQGGAAKIETVTIDCTLSSEVATSTLVMNFPSTVGHIDLIVEVDGVDTFFQPMSSTSTTVGVTVATENVVWGPNYYRDAKRCRDRFINRFRQLAPPFDRLNEAIAVILTLPDPPPPDYFRTLRQLYEIAVLVDRVGREAPPEIAREVYRFFERRLVSSPKLATRILPTEH